MFFFALDPNSNQENGQQNQTGNRTKEKARVLENKDCGIYSQNIRKINLNGEEDVPAFYRLCKYV